MLDEEQMAALMDELIEEIKAEVADEEAKFGPEWQRVTRWAEENSATMRLGKPAWVGEHPERVAVPDGLDGDTPESVTRKMVWSYPSLYPTLTDAVEHQFFRYNSYYDWEDGTFVGAHWETPEFEEGLQSEDEALLLSLEAARHPGRTATPEAVEFDLRFARDMNAQRVGVRTDFEAAVKRTRPARLLVSPGGSVKRTLDDRMELFDALADTPMRDDWAEAYRTEGAAYAADLSTAAEQPEFDQVLPQGGLWTSDGGLRHGPGRLL